jgi:hypothetical protein
MRSPIMRRSSSICASPGKVLQPRQLDLQLALVALRALAEDFQNQHRAVGHRHTQVLFEVALLSGRQGLVEQHRLGPVGLHQRLDLVGLARAHEERCIRRLAACHDARHRQVAGRLGQQGQFVETLVERLALAEVDAHQNRPGRARRLRCRGRVSGTQGGPGRYQRRRLQA